MDDWIILSKLLVMIYCGLKYSSGGLQSATSVILIMLVYVSVNMLYYIMKSKKFKSIMSILSIIIVITAAFSLNPLFIMFFPLNAIELVYKYVNNALLSGLLILAPVFIIKHSIVFEYLIISYLSLLIFILAYKLQKKISESSNEIDILREKNSSLYERLNRDNDYEKQVIYSSQLEERNKIAQEMHDKIGHSISGSLIQLEASKILIADDTNKARDMIQTVINALREGMESIRATLRNIKPATEQMGINRLKLLLDDFSLNNNLKATFVYSGNLEKITHIQWKILYENSKEALTNAVKYSRASAINVNIEVLNRFVKMEIRDNGIGAHIIKKGLGLAGIEERTEGSGGKVIIDGSKGFSLITLLPVGG
jgi:signal transduction histidine kinase